MSYFSKPHFHDEQAAYDFVESRVWPNGPVCPRCKECERVSLMRGKSTRIGAYKCYACRKPFTVKIGTIFEASHVPLHKWLQAMFLMVSSKKGISSNQLARTLDVTVKTAWFLSHRIREAMRTGDLEPLGSGGGTVEADETFIGHREGVETRGGGYSHKMKVLSLVERGGSVRSMVMDRVTKSAIQKALNENIAREARLMTDTAPYYKRRDLGFDSHQTVDHGKGEYVRGDVYTNTLEGYFSIFKRGMKGVYQHCREKHLHRYLAEFDFRYNARMSLGVDDIERTEKAVLGAVGKRLTYKATHRVEG